MMLLVLAVLSSVIVLALLGRAIVSDGYGVRPPPRSHHAVDDVDNWGMPTKYAGLR
jgi:hypothetical protein